MAAREWDVIVVGGGHNGLVASAYLARAGLDVLLLERRAIVGGLCVTEELFPGFRSNAVANSAHNLDPRVVVELELEEHGLRFAYPDPSAFMAFPSGRAFISYQDEEDKRGQLEQFSRRDVEGYAGLVEYLSQLARALRVSFFRPPTPFAEMVSGLTTPQLEEAFAKVVFGSIGDLVDEWLESEELKTTLVMTAVNTSFAGPRTPGTPLMLMQRPLQHWSMNQEQTGGRLRSRFHHLGASRWTPIGGMGAITQALRRSAEALGVVVRTDAAVEQVIVSGDRATGVVLGSGEEFSARTVMLNVNPKTALLDLVSAEHLDPSFRRRMENVRMRGSAFKAHLALDGLPRFKIARSADENEQLAKCGFRMAGTVSSMERAFAEAQLGRWSSEHPMLWGMIPSAVDPTLTPPGKHVMSVSVFYAPYELEAGKDWGTEREAYGRRIVEVLGEYIENLDSIISDTRFFSPVDLEEQFGLTNAQASHGDVLPIQYFANRPLAGWSDYRTPVAGLYLCGSGSWPGNYVSGIAGLNATEVLLTDIADMDKARRGIEWRLAAERFEEQAGSTEPNEPEDAAV